MLTDRGHRNLRDGLNELKVLGDGGLLNSGVDKLQELTNGNHMTV